MLLKASSEGIRVMFVFGVMALAAFYQVTESSWCSSFKRGD